LGYFGAEGSSNAGVPYDQATSACCGLAQVNWLFATAVSTFNVSPAELKKVKLDGVQFSVAASPVSRARQDVPAPNYGVEVVQADDLPIDREFQRVMFALAVWAGAGLFDEMTNDTQSVGYPR
jgi:hypothetical protein